MGRRPARSLKVLSITVLVLAMGVGACSKKSSGGGSPGGGGNGLGPGIIAGIVFDIGTGARLSGVTVAGGGMTTTTGSDGQFTFTGVSGTSVPLTFTLAGYAPGNGNADPSGSQGDSMVVQLKKHGAYQAYDPTTTATLKETTEAGPYALTLQAGSLATSDTALQVAITPIDPTKEGGALPGKLVTAGASGAMLSPVTFAEFTILDSGGNRVQLKSTASAMVELPIPPSLRATYPLSTTIHCYAYDPVLGSWNDFVDGTVTTSSVDGVTPVLNASLRHFSWYGGAPQAADCQTVIVKIVSAITGAPLGAARVDATPGTTAYTDANGIATVWAEQGVPVTYFATQTGIDVDGSLTGMKGAKYIEYGKVDEELFGLVTKPCNSINGSPGVTTPGVLGGDTADPLVVKIGAINKLTYEATAVLLAGTGGANGTISVFLQSGIPDVNGQLQSPQAASGAVITLAGNGSSTVLKEVAPGSGSYALDPAGAPISIVAGQSYTLSIDADGNGSIDGSGSVVAVGQLAWTNPTDGATLPASGLVASWSDTSSGTAGYAPLYFAVLSSSGDAATFVGTARQFSPMSALNPANPLTPGSYTGDLEAFSGVSGSLSLGFNLSNNITGAAVTGTLFSFVVAPTITFTLQ